MFVSARIFKELIEEVQLHKATVANLREVVHSYETKVKDISGVLKVVQDEINALKRDRPKMTINTPAREKEKFKHYEEEERKARLREIEDRHGNL